MPRQRLETPEEHDEMALANDPAERAKRLADFKARSGNTRWSQNRRTGEWCLKPVIDGTVQP